MIQPIRKAEPEDVAEVCRGLRQEDIDEALAMYGVHPADFLPKHYLPEETWALTGKSGRPTGLGGTAPTSWPGLGQIWLVSTPAIYEPGNDLLFLRLSSAFIEMCHERYPILFNYVDARQERHLKWLRACGFSAVKLRDPWGVAGLPFYEMVKVQGGDYPLKR